MKREPRRYKKIYGNYEDLIKLAQLYSDCEPRLQSDEYHDEVIGYTNRGYKKFVRIEDGPINHIVLLITSKQWHLLTRCIPIERDSKLYKTWRLI